MKDAECITFLQWALPRLNMRWRGFRKVRRQVCKRIARRLKELGLDSYDQYQERLSADPDEWQVLDAACRITISRFYRDKHVFDVLGRDVLPALAIGAFKEQRPLRCWCAGCASGEEAYTLAILWNKVISPAHPTVEFEVIATDADPHMIERAQKACYSPGSLKDIPADWLEEEFERSGDEYCVGPQHRRLVSITSQDIREELPQGSFDLILCRNLVLTYFDTPLQRRIVETITERLVPGGYLVIGAHEQLPTGDFGLEARAGCSEILKRRDASKPEPAVELKTATQI